MLLLQRLRYWIQTIRFDLSSLELADGATCGAWNCWGWAKHGDGFAMVLSQSRRTLVRVEIGDNGTKIFLEIPLPWLLIPMPVSYRG